MTEADLEGGLRLSRASGWNQTLADWRLLLSLGPGLFRVALRGSEVVASGGAVCYGEALAWICMILVRPDERGHGLGTRIFDEVLERVRSLVRAGQLRAVGLDATPAGRPIYQERGFVDGPRLVRMRLEPGRDGGGMPSGVARLTAAEVVAVLERDREVFGADRAAVLRRALGSAPELAFTAASGGAYCFGRHGDHADHLGPIVASELAQARDLLSACLCAPGDRPVMLDARAEPAWLEALEALGFREQRPFTRMYLGKTRPRARPELEPAVVGPEFG